MAANETEDSSGYRAVEDNRIEPGSINITPCDFPPGCPASSTEDPWQAVQRVIEAFNRALGEGHDSVLTLFHPDGFWRDHLCLTWDLRTLHGVEAISGVLSRESRLERVDLDLSTAGNLRIGHLDVAGKVQGILFFIRVVTRFGTGRGFVRLMHVSPGEWKIFSLYTVLQELAGFEEPTGPRRGRGEYLANEQNWVDRRSAEVDFHGKDPTVLIVGTSDLVGLARLVESPAAS